MSTTDSSWWMQQSRQGFSTVCCDYFGVTFDNAPTFISRSEFIPVHGRPHRLKKTVAVVPTTSEANAIAKARKGQQKVSRVQHIGTRMSAKAMRSGGSLLGANVGSR